jgi:hypothetical protein
MKVVEVGVLRVAATAGEPGGTDARRCDLGGLVVVRGTRWVIQLLCDFWLVVGPGVGELGGGRSPQPSDALGVDVSAEPEGSSAVTRRHP